MPRILSEREGCLQEHGYRWCMVVMSSKEGEDYIKSSCPLCPTREECSFM